MPPLGNLSQLGGGAVTQGGAAIGGALGAAAGAGAYDDYKTLGHSTARALAEGAFTGVGAAAVALFIPGGAVAVAMGVGIRGLFNELVNRPMEQAAERGSGLDPAVEANFKNLTHEQKAAAYTKEAQKRRREAADTRPGYFEDPSHFGARLQEKMGEARNLQQQANMEIERGRQAPKKAEDSRMKARMDELTRIANSGPGMEITNALQPQSRMKQYFETPDHDETVVQEALKRGATFDPKANEYRIPDWVIENDRQAEKLLDRLDRQQGPSSGLYDLNPSGGAGRVNTLRNGETTVRLPRRAADDMAATLKRHNTLSTDYGG